MCVRDDLRARIHTLYFLCDITIATTTQMDGSLMHRAMRGKRQEKTERVENNEKERGKTTTIRGNTKEATKKTTTKITAISN